MAAMAEENQLENKRLSFEQTVRELEDCFFSRAVGGKLYKFILEAVEKPLIENTLDRTEGNQSRAARILGLNRNTLHSKIKKLGIEVARWKS